MIDVKELFHEDKKKPFRGIYVERPLGSGLFDEKGRRVRGIDRSIERLAYHYNVRKDAE